MYDSANKHDLVLFFDIVTGIYSFALKGFHITGIIIVRDKKDLNNIFFALK